MKRHYPPISLSSLPCTHPPEQLHGGAHYSQFDAQFFSIQARISSVKVSGR